MCESIKVRDLEKYLSIFVLDLSKKYQHVTYPVYILECGCEEINSLYEQRINKLKCVDKSEISDEGQIQVGEHVDWETTSCLLFRDTSCDDKTFYFHFNSFDLFRGIRHVLKIEEADGKSGMLLLSMLEKHIFIDSGLKCNFYQCGDLLEPFIIDKSVRNRILCEILLDLYQSGYLRTQNEEAIISLKFSGDKHLANVWKKGIKMGTWCEIRDASNFSENTLVQELVATRVKGEHVFHVEFCHAETSEVMLATDFKQSFEQLIKFFQVE